MTPVHDVIRLADMVCHGRFVDTIWENPDLYLLSLSSIILLLALISTRYDTYILHPNHKNIQNITILVDTPTLKYCQNHTFSEIMTCDHI